jgi:16S rRNA (cytosine1402-N4)-methyltransferase
MNSPAPRPNHIPVLCADVVRFLAGRGGILVDGTIGLGGHAEALLAADPAARLVGIDRDPHALERARERLACFGNRVQLVHGSFADLDDHLARLGARPVNGVLLDLGVSSMQLDDASRGFSLRADGPLDMRMDPTLGATAADWLAIVDVRDLERVLATYGEERYARRIARAIETARGHGPIRTTAELVDVIHRAVPGVYFAEKIDPATRTFQALRIAVNGELEALERGLEKGFAALAEDGVLVVISFHSLEDRRVKTFLRERAAACTCPPDLPECRCGKKVEAQILTRKPIVASPTEIAANPRSRSAKLRAARRVI